MKRVLPFLALLASGSLLQADVIIEQKIESAMLNGNMVMKIKGDHARVDMPSPAGAVTMLADINAGQIVMLISAQKMAMKMNMADIKKAAQAQLDTAAAPKDSGQKEKIGDYDCEVYTIDTPQGPAKFWVAKDFPNYKSLAAQMKKLSELSATGLDPSKFDLGGMVMKVESSTPAGKVVMTLVSAKEQPVADSEFVMPTGYTEMPMPGPK